MLKNVALLLALACLAQHVLAAQSEGAAGRKGRGKAAAGKGKGAAGRGASAHKSRAENEVFQGKFSTQDKARCAWSASGRDAFTVRVACKRGKLQFACEYAAKPVACPQYEAKSKAYWKQISRVLKKQQKLCEDASALIKSGVCKSAHFRLNAGTSAPPLGPTGAQGGKSCKDSVDQKKLAEEQCSGSWSSLCTFFFSMVQSEDC